MNWLTAGILAYVAAQLLVCLWVVRRNRSEQDYLVAGRRLGVPVVAVTIFATWFGAETCIGAAGSIYEGGLAGARTDPFGYALCIFVMGAFFAVRLYRRGLMTLGDFYRQRYGPGVEKLAVMLMVPGSVIWAAAQILAFGHVLAATSELSLEFSVIAASIFVVAYTVLGGLLADVISDLIQGLVLALGLVVLFVLVVADGFEGGALTTAFAPERLTFRSDGESWWSVLDGWSIPLLGSLFSAELVTRILAANSAETARRASFLGGGFYLLVGSIPLTLGMLGPGILPGLESGEALLPSLAEAYLPTALYIVFAGALVSAILSTVDSALLAAGTQVSHNIFVPFVPGLSERGRVLAARLSVAVFGGIACLLALNADSVLGLVEEASAFGSAGLFVCCLLGLTQPLGGRTTAAVTMCWGALSYGVLAHVVQHDFAYLLAVLTTFCLFLVVMLLEGRGDTYDLVHHGA